MRPTRPSRPSTAGIDMEMVSRLFAGHLPRLVEGGQGPARPPSTGRAAGPADQVPPRPVRAPYADEAREASVLSAPEHQAAAREVAARSLVLLKNEGDVLPLKPQLRSIAVLGPLADDRDAPLSHWRGDGRVEDVVTLLAGIRRPRPPSRPGLQVAHAKGCEIEGGSTEASPRPSAWPASRRWRSSRWARRRA